MSLLEAVPARESRSRTGHPPPPQDGCWLRNTTMDSERAMRHGRLAGPKSRERALGEATRDPAGLPRQALKELAMKVRFRRHSRARETEGCRQSMLRDRQRTLSVRRRCQIETRPVREPAGAVVETAPK